jgi:hypothetical protein
MHFTKGCPSFTFIDGLSVNELQLRLIQKYDFKANTLFILHMRGY